MKGEIANRSDHPSSRIYKERFKVNEHSLPLFNKIWVKMLFIFLLQRKYIINYSSIIKTKIDYSVCSTLEELL